MYSIGIHETTAILYEDREARESVTGNSFAIEKFIEEKKKLHGENIEIFGKFTLRELKKKEESQNEFSE